MKLFAVDEWQDGSWITLSTGHRNHAIAMFWAERHCRQNFRVRSYPR